MTKNRRLTWVVADLLREDAYSMFCLSAAMRVLLPENVFIIDVIFIACKSTPYERSLMCTAVVKTPTVIFARQIMEY